MPSVGAPRLRLRLRASIAAHLVIPKSGTAAHGTKVGHSGHQKWLTQLHGSYKKWDSSMWDYATWRLLALSQHRGRGPR